MAFTTPFTAVANGPCPAAAWNAGVRDNLLETMPAKATGVAAHFVCHATNSIAERQVVQSVVDALDSTTQGTFGDITGGTVGPFVTVTCSRGALTMISCQVNTSAANAWGQMSYSCDAGASFGAADANAVTLSGSSASSANRAGVTDLRIVSAASHTFKAEYKTFGASVGFLRRRLAVMAF